MNYDRTRLAKALAYLALAAISAGACSDEPKHDAGGTPPPADGGIDSGSSDAGTGVDAGGGSSNQPDAAIPSGGDGGRDGAVTAPTDGSVVDAGGGAADAGGGAADAGPPDAGPPDAGPPPCNATAAPSLPALRLEPVAGVGTLPMLVFAAQPPGSSDWYLVQQTGQIKVLSAGALRAAAFLDVSANIAVAADDERGLLGLAFPPDYAASGKFYVMMTATGGADANADIVLEYTRSAADPFVADPSSKKEIIDLGPSAANHNGGNIVFGNDGFLYVGTGDGGGGCNDNQPGAPQDVSLLFGKILRLDPRAAGPLYAAAGNPFAGGGDPRVLHYGLRNPYRFGFDRRTGDLYLGDVGQNTYEEVDFAAAGSSGLNFGWPKFEGNHVDTCGAGKMLRAGSTDTKPIVDIDRQAAATGPFANYKSVIGGWVYRGLALPQLQGVYLFGDYVGTRLGALVQCGAQTSPVTPILKNKDPNTSAPFFAQATGQPSFNALTAIVPDNAGELYFVANRNTLLKVVPGP